VGVRRAALAPGLRALFHGRYGIYYVVTPDSIDVIRVLHGARDAQAQFDDDNNTGND
jgi:toxin ParE1/3/4